MSAEWQFLVTLNERLRPLKDPVGIQDIAVRSLGEHLGASRVTYAHVDDDQFVLIRSYATGVQPFVDRGPIAIFGAAIVDACRRGGTVVVNDVGTDERFSAIERAETRARETSAFVVAPLIKDGQWIAMFAVESSGPRIWTPDQVALVEVTAQRMWGIGERARVEEALSRSESRQAFLHRLNDGIRPLADPSRILAEACRLLGTHLRVNRVAYGQIEGDDCIISDDYVDGVPSHAGRFRWGDLGASRTDDILKGGTLSVNDTSREVHAPEERLALQAAGIGAYICPLLVKDGRFVAAFGIHSRTPRVWTPDEIALVQEVADRIWSTLEHRKAETERRLNEARMAFLLRLNDALRPLNDPVAVQETAARLLAEHLGATRVGYAELEGREYVIRREHAREVSSMAGTVRISVGDVLRELLRRGETVAVSDVDNDPRLSETDRVTFRSREIAAFVGVALLKAGRMVAFFGANHNQPRAWTGGEIELVRDVAVRTWDAVERTRAEAALREQKHRLHLALEASAGGSWSWEASTNRVHWDERFRALYGFAPGEPARSDAWLPCVHEEDRPRMAAELNEMMSSTTKDSWENTFRIVRPDGTVAWLQSRGRAERDADGRLVRMTGLDLDFSEHRRAEEALQARRDEEHDRTLRTLLETATQGIVSVDAHGTILTANHAFERMFGWGPGELVGQPIAPLMWPPFSGARHGQRDVHTVGARRDGSTFPIELTVNHVATGGGGRAFAFVTDITDRQRAASALQARTEELEDRTTQLSQMASDLTLAEQRAREQIAKTLHDGLQQLLVIVSLNLEQQLKRDSLRGAPPSEPLAEAKRHLDEAVAAARSLSVELFPPVLARSGLPAALKWLAGWIHDKYKLEVQIHVDPRADSARKDIRTLLFESVRELLFNAVKHAAAERATLELVLDAEDRLCITVTDQGAGFDPWKLENRLKSGQAGWGLFSIRERLTLLGGQFEIDSARGRGTRVRLVAPRGAAPDVDEGAKAPSLERVGVLASRDSSRAAAGVLRILIVDDHATFRKALRETIEERPQLSIVGDASNGLEAIAHAHTLRPDVILMDVTMPHMDGVEATARIHAELPDIEIFGLSMHARSETVHAIELAGAANYFVKGVDTQRLIDHLLAAHALRYASERAGS